MHNMATLVDPTFWQAIQEPLTVIIGALIAAVANYLGHRQANGTISNTIGAVAANQARKDEAAAELRKAGGETK